MSAIASLLKDNLARIEDRILAACTRAGRSRDSVTLVAVTKSVTPEVAALLPDLGVRDLGENRPQELWRKAAALSGVRWHFIGHLQRNKIERTVPLLACIHSIDSQRLLDALEAHGQALEGFLEFNCSGEPSKGGFAPHEVESLAGRIATLRHVRITGVMTMAAADNPIAARRSFALLHQLGQQLGVPQRSMGMSGDFEIAIEEGSTHLRIGSTLFEGLA
ncbi:MAG: YggS family pyridoxal phosphate-dependent enzyme [Gemmataceae bacterium]